MTLLPAFLVAFGVLAVSGQRITTIQLDGVQYFISRMNPYSPELNYFLAYQYCRSIGLQLASFETKEKSDSIMEYLSNAGYQKYDFWTSGNRLGTDMLIWMSTGLPFNATFDYMRKTPGEEGLPVARQLGAVEQRKDSGAANGCVALKAPDLVWDTDDCAAIKDFICEQTRCYYYNYGSIPVSTAQGNKRVKVSTTPTAPTTTTTTTTTTTPSPIPTAMVEEAANTTQTTEQPSSSAPCEQTNPPQADPVATTENPADENTTEYSNETTVTDELVPKGRSASSRSSTPDQAVNNENVPWSWARNIMLEKPVLKKSSSL